MIDGFTEFDGTPIRKILSDWMKMVEPSVPVEGFAKEVTYSLADTKRGVIARFVLEDHHLFTMRFRSRRIARTQAKKYTGKYVINHLHMLEGATIQRLGDSLVMNIEFDFNAV